MSFQADRSVAGGRGLLARVSAVISALVVAVSGASAQDAPASPAAPAAGSTAAMEYVRLDTSVGPILLELDATKAPISVANFLKYTDEGFYDGTVFHRVISGFMIQGGGHTADLKEKETGPAIKNESGNGLTNVRGSIAMARTAELDSATSQFYINHVDNPALDQRNYAVFGKVAAGLSVVDQIARVEVTRVGALANVPAVTITLQKAARVKTDDLSALIAEVNAEADKAAKAAAEAWKSATQSRSKAAMDKGLELVKSKGVDVSNARTTDSGLIIIEVKAGEGASPAPTDQVEVHYTGMLVDGMEFDSSKRSGQPAVFGLNQVIKGWTEGLGNMKPGGHAWLVIPPSLGWGARPNGKIPANSVTVFEVELLSVK